MPLIRAALLLLFLVPLLVAPDRAAAQLMSNCSASMTNVAFGSISLRAGVTNQISGSLTLSCAQLLSSVGICVRFGPGNGGAGSQNAPRYIRRADGAAIGYDLRLGDGIGSGRNDVFVRLGSLLGTRTTIPVFATITSSGASTGTGEYSSTFASEADARIEYPVSSCSETGRTVKAIPPFSVGASVRSLCEVEGATLDFGRINPGTNGPIDGAAQLSVRCTSDTPYAIRLGPGLGVGASGPTDRRLTGPGGQLRYGLYQDAGRSRPWGNQPGNDVRAVGTAAAQTATVYGRIFSGQSLRAGRYEDSVLVTIEY